MDVQTIFRAEEGHNVEHQDMVLAKRAADLLHKHYPNYLWAVHCNSEGGVLDIKNLNISMEYGYRLMLADVYQDPGLRCVMRAGGEILERAGMPRRGNIGAKPQYIDGVKPQHQPRNGIIF